MSSYNIVDVAKSMVPHLIAKGITIEQIIKHGDLLADTLIDHNFDCDQIVIVLSQPK